MSKKNDIDTWLFNSFLKTIIDALIAILRLMRPSQPKPNPNPKPIIPLPNKPIFPWLRKKIDNIIKEK